MDWWGEVRLALQGFLDQHGVLAGFVLVLIEEAGVPVPVPGDFLMLALGVHARQGNVQLWQALLVLETATLLGASLLYHGTRAIVLGRLTPGLRMATVIGCGIFGVPFWRFLPSLALGSFAYILMYTLLGYFVGPTV